MSQRFIYPFLHFTLITMQALSSSSSMAPYVSTDAQTGEDCRQYMLVPSLATVFKAVVAKQQKKVVVAKQQTTNTHC